MLAEWGIRTLPDYSYKAMPGRASQGGSRAQDACEVVVGQAQRAQVLVRGQQVAGRIPKKHRGHLVHRGGDLHTHACTTSHQAVLPFTWQIAFKSPAMQGTNVA